jgi:hypothetical protein
MANSILIVSLRGSPNYIHSERLYTLKHDIVRLAEKVLANSYCILTRKFLYTVNFISFPIPYIPLPDKSLNIYDNRAG